MFNWTYSIKTNEHFRWTMENQSSGISLGNSEKHSQEKKKMFEWNSLFLFQKEIVLTTPTSVMKIPAGRCDRLNSSDICLSAMDPYCTWNNNQQRCVLYTKLSSTFSASSSRSLTCPILNLTSLCLFDGRFFHWALFIQLMADGHHGHHGLHVNN